MELLFFWFGTVVASLCMQTINELRLFKDAADNGYKINIRAMTIGEEKFGYK